MALQGTLDTFALADLVRLLATTTKTGELAIDGDRGSGRLCFVDGDLVGGDPGGAENALFALLRLADGSFRFEPGAEPTEPVDALDALEVLAGAEARLEAWRPVEALVPTLDVTLSLRAELADDQVIVDRETWRQILVIAPGPTARAFAAALDLDEVDAAVAVKTLADLGLVTVGPPAESPELAESPEADVPPVTVIAAAPVEDVEAVAAEDAVVVAPVDEEPAVGALADLLAPYDAESAPSPFEPVAHDPFVADLPPEGAGSLAVDLDHHLGSPALDHRYLGGEASALPEALPEPAAEVAPVPVAADEEVAEADDVDDVGEADEDDARPEWPAPVMDEDDLALQLEALSPAAARAVAAAASAEGRDPDDDAGRRVLRRIISSGRG